MNYDPNNPYNAENGNGAEVNNTQPAQGQPINEQAERSNEAQQQGSWGQQQGSWGQQQNGWAQQQGGWGQQQGGWAQQQSGWGQQQSGWGQQQGGWGQQQGNWEYPNGPYYPPNAPVTTNDASTSKTLGIIGLILALFCCPLAGLILGILAIARAKRAKQLSGGIEPPDAATGRICGIIAIIFAVLSMISTFITVIINMMLL